MSGPLDRPLPPRSRAEAARHWVAWFGPWRLVATGVAACAVAIVAVLLVRTPPTTAEATLPVATAASTTPASPSSAPSAATSSAEPGRAPDVAVPDDDGAGATVTGAAPTTLVVHVVGEVIVPGVYELPSGSRVVDAVAAAGGPTGSARTEALNLAAPLVDGQRVRVPAPGDDVDEVPDVPAATTGSRAGGDDGGSRGPVDLNRAGIAELQTLPGIGPATAAAIVEHREREGPFVTVDDLVAVRGIGPAKLEAVRDAVTT